MEASDRSPPSLLQQSLKRTSGRAQVEKLRNSEFPSLLEAKLQLMKTICTDV